MPNNKTGDLQINVPVNTDPQTREEVLNFAQATVNDPNAFQSFKDAVEAAGINVNELDDKKRPPYLLIGGALLISYFLFFK